LSGIEAASARPVQLRYNGVNRANDNDNERRYGSYLHVEAIDGQWADDHYPNDPGGNIYSKARPDVKWSIRSTEAMGPDSDRYRSDGWSKGSNESLDDWSDLHRFMRVMNNTSSDEYFQGVSEVVDVEQWTRWFAFMTIVLSRETNLSNGTDDDYKLYSGLEDKRFKLIPHDFDTIFGLGDTDTDPDDSIFPAITNFGGQTMPQLNEFFNEPKVLRLYYKNLEALLSTVFSKDKFDSLVENSLNWLPEDSDVLSDVISFMDDRRVYILSQISGGFTAQSSLSSSNSFARTTDQGLTGLEGTFDAKLTTEIRVNGMSVPLNRRDGTWDGDLAETEVVFSAGSEWKYLDDGSDQGIEWRHSEPAEKTTSVSAKSPSHVPSLLLSGTDIPLTLISVVSFASKVPSKPVKPWSVVLAKLLELDSELCAVNPPDIWERMYTLRSSIKLIISLKTSLSSGSQFKEFSTRLSNLSLEKTVLKRASRFL
jgi:hypothetical protein